MLVFPDYYPAFRCIAGACSHSCCLGWEIDVDKESLARYRRVRGAMGRRLRRSITGRGGTAHFRLEEGERCPFLNQNNLCALILWGGEGMLCQICRDHPRFRNFWPSRTELGLGLCCEAAGRLLLAKKGPVRLLRQGDGPEASGAEKELLRLRLGLFHQLFTAQAPLQTLLQQVGAALPQQSSRDWAADYLQLERLDAQWTARLEALAAAPALSPWALPQDMDWAFRRLLHYFLYRHLAGALEDGRLKQRAAFAVLSVQMLLWLGALERGEKGQLTLEALVELARLYSSEVEYSAENLEKLFALLQ